MAQIYWEQFTWEAFATLTTGAAAVAGAVVIGLRQAKIADRQSKILSRQVALDELQLRSDLFDRRWAVYEATREFLGEIMRHAAEPNQEIQRKFLLAKNEAEFLFQPAVGERLQDVWERSCAFFAVKSVSDHLYQTTGTYGPENIEKSHAYMLWLTELLGKLGELFGDELKLASIAGAPTSFS